jgi:hypothetical protein
MEEFIATYRQIYDQHKLNNFLEEDEFSLGKIEMTTFVSFGEESRRVTMINELKRFLEDDTNQINDIQILSFFSSVSSRVDDPGMGLEKIWSEHNELIDFYYDNQKKVALREFLLLVIDAMKNQERKASLEKFVKTKYKEDNFLDFFATEVKMVSPPTRVSAPPTPLVSASTPPLPLGSAPPPIQSTTLGEVYAEQESSIITNYALGGALIGAGLGIGTGLLVSALGAGIVLSAPVVATVLVGATIGIGVGAVAGLTLGMVQNACANRITNEEQISNVIK